VHRASSFVIFPILALGIGALLSLSGINSKQNLGENGLFELLQLFVLLVSAALWAFRGSFAQSVNVSVASVLLVFAGREASWMGVYGGSDEFVSFLKIAHSIVLIGTLAVLFFLWSRPVFRQRKLFRNTIFSRCMIWMILGVAFILAGDVFEKEFFDLASNLFWEEWLELSGYFCFAIPPLIGCRTQSASLVKAPHSANSA